ncbi:hypothetical protein G7Y89_g14481 [Cudoniella acicularis]|uniref:Uncharacterized protein n=1 Tax=Cudoniella acicularis TaxID=354080 RepID=A0A8H4R3H1_9HELO|nr:hypothetical protein G7Y89_g14481 [Cudoniella acicularis]
MVVLDIVVVFGKGTAATVSWLLIEKAVVVEGAESTVKIEPVEEKRSEMMRVVVMAIAHPLIHELRQALYVELLDFVGGSSKVQPQDRWVDQKPMGTKQKELDTAREMIHQEQQQGQQKQIGQCAYAIPFPKDSYWIVVQVKHQLWDQNPPRERLTQPYK